MRARATASAAAAGAALLLAHAGAHAQAAAPAPAPPTVRAVTADAATLSAPLPAKARGPVHFSWRGDRGGWRRVVARRTGARRVTARLTGLRPATTHRVRLVLAGRAGRETRFTTLATAAPQMPVASPPPAEQPAPDPPSRTPQPPAPPAPPAQADAPAARPAPTPTAPPGGYLNPVFGGEFPDPMVLRDGDMYWAYASGPGFRILRSTDLVSWRGAGTALEERPRWAISAEDWHPWAPSVARSERPCPTAEDGPCFVLFFVALSDAFGPVTNCVGVATSDRPGGPFLDRGPLADADGAPIGCGDANGYGNIDPAPFVASDGSAHLYVSTDWTCDADAACALAPELSAIPLSADLLSAAGPRTPLFRGLPDTWEQAPWAPVVENPWVVERDGVFHLLYSGGGWTGEYGMGHATATSPTGPFTRTGRFLAGTERARSAGGGMVIEGPKGGDWLAYHARAGSFTAPRTLRIDPLAWPGDGGAPTVAGPSADPVATGP